MQAVICECGARLDDPELRLFHGQAAKIQAPCVCDQPGSMIAKQLLREREVAHERSLQVMAEAVDRSM